MNSIRRLLLLVGIFFAIIPPATAAVAPPVVTEVLPSTGPAAGGTTVVITGTGFSGASTVTFGGADAQIFFINSDTQISAISPAGVGTVDVVVTNSAGSSGVSTATKFTYGPPTLTMTPAPTTFTGGTVGRSYNLIFAASGGTSPYSYSISAGSLPPGLTLLATGAVRGTPTAAGTFSFSVRATDNTPAASGGPFTVTQNYSVVIAAPTITLSPSSVPGGTIGQAYNQTLSAAGGTGPYTYAIASGALPAGLALSTSGQLSGTPTAAGTFNFTVSATDSSTGTGAPFSAQQSYSLTIAAPTVVITPNTLPDPRVTFAYSQTLTASGGTAPYVFSLSSGTLPPGISLSSDGVLSGAPTSTGTYNFSITATDSSRGAGPFSAVRAYSVTIAPPGLSIYSPDLSGAVGQNYSGSFVADGGNAPYTFRVTTGVLPTGLTLDSSGLLSGTPLVAGTFIFSVAASDSTTGPGAPFMVGSSFAMTIDPGAPPPAPVIVTPANGELVATSIVAFAGTSVPGTTVRIYIDGSYGGVSSVDNAGNWTIPALMQLADGSHTVFATAMDAFDRISAHSATVTFTTDTIAPAAPVILTPANDSVMAPGSVTVTGTAEPRTTITVRLNGSANGTTTADGAGAWSYTTTSLVAGDYAISATAADLAGNVSPASAANSVRLASAPTVQNVSVSVPYDTATPIDLAPSISGSYTSIAIGTAPAFGALSISGSVVTYTPVSGYYGTDSFTYYATGVGGSSVRATVSITVLTPPPPTAADISNVAVPYASRGTAIDLSGSIDGVYRSVAIGTAPSHGTVTITGATATYTPASSYYGADSFTFTATGPGGTSAPARVAITVATPAAPVVVSPAAVTVAGATSAGATRATIDLAPTVSGVSSGFALVSAPAHGTATLAGTVVTYVPAAGYAGADSFTFQAQGPGGASNLGTVAITVQPTAAVAQALTASAGDGETITVDLMAGATGGPFTGAAIVSVSAAGSTASIVEGGTADNRAYSARITVGSHFNGALLVRYTLSNAFGPSAEATITVNVTARPDPSADPAVRALSEMQAESTLRFALTQSNNFMRRMENLHRNSNPGPASMGLRLTFPHLRDPGLAPLQRQQMVEKAMVAHFRSNGDNSPARAERSAAAPMNAVETGRRNGSIGAWSGGTIEFGTQDLNSGKDKVEVTSSGVSLGADIKLTEGVIVGLGGGFGWDRREATGGAKLRGNSSVAIGYASFTPRSDLFVDALFGLGSVDFKTRRPVSGMAGEATAKRGGSLTMGSLAFGIDTGGNKLNWSLYGRAEWLAARLDAYVESGAGTLSLRYDERRIESLGSVLGGRIGTSLPMGSVIVKPRLRAEWRHEFQDLAIQTLDYANVAGPSTFGIGGINWAADRLETSLGSVFLLPDAWALDLELGLRTDGRGRLGSARIELSKQF